MLENSWVAAQLAASQEWLSSMELVSVVFIFTPSCFFTALCLVKRRYNFILCYIWDFHGGNDEEYCLMDRDTV
jgi:hypothetical protein